MYGFEKYTEYTVFDTDFSHCSYFECCFFSSFLLQGFSQRVKSRVTGLAQHILGRGGSGSEKRPVESLELKEQTSRGITALPPGPGQQTAAAASEPPSSSAGTTPPGTTSRGTDPLQQETTLGGTHTSPQKVPSLERTPSGRGVKGGGGGHKDSKPAWK